jgi:hypothetical protein
MENYLELKLMNGCRAQLEMEILLKIAEPKTISDLELKNLFAPLERRSSLLAVDGSKSLTLFASGIVGKY